MKRVYNFGAGPAVLPLEVLQEAQAEMCDFKGTGMSLLEHSHRGKAFEAVHEEAIANIKSLLKLSDDYAVLFVQGGASVQFAMVPMNLLGQGQTADYINSGAWASKALKEAKLIGNVNLAANCEKEIPTRVPLESELKLTPNAAYVHITSNETISGAQWKNFPRTQAPLVADMSSDFLSRDFDAGKFGLIYAGAQKNIAPAGMAVVIIRKDLAERVPQNIPTMFKYKTFIEENSLYNTPPCFTIYICMLVTRWIMKVGQENLYRKNVEKAAKIYKFIDSGTFYKGTAVPACRSDMNITFRLPSEQLEEQFVKDAEKRDLKGLKGHRSVGGVRASIYNAFPMEGVDTLVSFMAEFQKSHG
ncbi:MAG: 3-phosphoserine/phosphohydroxythreonine transaminase [bacterium]